MDNRTGRILQQFGMTKRALENRQSPLVNFDDGTKFELLWQCFADAVSWRAEESDEIADVRREIRDLRKTVRALERDSTTRALEHGKGA